MFLLCRKRNIDKHVEQMISAQSLKCSKTNEIIGTPVKAIITTGSRRVSLLKIKKQVALKATTMPAMEMKSVVSPNTYFADKDTRKSISVKRDVRIDKNINIEVEEDNSAIASDMKNTLNQILSERVGVPVSGLLPPGTVKAAAKTTVVISVATSMQ